MEQIHISCGTISKINEHTLHFEIKDDCQIELKDAIILDRTFYEMSKGQAFFSIMNTTGKFGKFDHAAQVFLSREGKVMQENLVLGLVIILNSLPNRILAGFFINFYKPTYSLKIVKNDREAMDWIKMEIIHKNQNSSPF